MMEIKPHYNIIEVSNKNLEMLLEKYGVSVYLPSIITFSRLKNHLVISINIKCYLEDSESLEKTLLNNMFGVLKFVSANINGDDHYWDDIIYWFNYKTYQFYVNDKFIVDYEKEY